MKGGQKVCVVSVITALGFLSSSSYSFAAAVTMVLLPIMVAAVAVATTTVDVANPLKRKPDSRKTVGFKLSIIN